MQVVSRETLYEQVWARPMLKVARRRIDAQGLPQVSLMDADAQTHPFEIDAFDAVFSRFGVMFFADPSAAFTHLRTLVRAGGSLTFSCWQDPFANPWMTVPVMASVSVLGPPRLPSPGEPGPFSLAEPDTIRMVLGDAGWSDVDVTGLSVEQPFPAGDARGCAEVMSQLNPVLAGGIRDAPERLPELLDAVTDALRGYERDGAVTLPAAAWIVRATNES